MDSWTVAHQAAPSWGSPGKNAGVGSHSLLQGIFPTQGSNPGLLHCRQVPYHLDHWGSPRRQCILRRQRQPELVSVSGAAPLPWLPGWHSGKESCAMREPQETQIQSLGREGPLEEEMATHSSILAWRLPWTGEPSGPKSMGSPSWTRLNPHAPLPWQRNGVSSDFDAGRNRCTERRSRLLLDTQPIRTHTQVSLWNRFCWRARSTHSLRCPSVSWSLSVPDLPLLSPSTSQPFSTIPEL